MVQWSDDPATGVETVAEVYTLDGERTQCVVESLPGVSALQAEAMVKLDDLIPTLFP